MERIACSCRIVPFRTGSSLEAFSFSIEARPRHGSPLATWVARCLLATPWSGRSLISSRLMLSFGCVSVSFLLFAVHSIGLGKDFFWRAGSRLEPRCCLSFFVRWLGQIPLFLPFPEFASYLFPSCRRGRVRRASRSRCFEITDGLRPFFFFSSHHRVLIECSLRRRGCRSISPVSFAAAGRSSDRIHDAGRQTIADREGSRGGNARNG